MPVQNTGAEYPNSANVAEEGQESHNVAGQAVRIAGGKYAQQNANDQRQNLGRDHQQQSGWQFLQDEIGDGLIVEK